MRYALIGMLAFLALCCGSSRELADAERAKLHPMLQRLLEDPSGYAFCCDMSVRPDGTRVYAVIIRSSDPDELRKAGIPLSSVMGDVITARVSLEELRKVIRLPSVRWVETGSTNVPM